MSKYNISSVPTVFYAHFYIQHLISVGEMLGHNTLFQLNINWTLYASDIYGQIFKRQYKFLICLFVLFCYICSRLVLTWNLQNSLFGLLAVRLTSPYFLPRYAYSRIFFFKLWHQANKYYKFIFGLDLCANFSLFPQQMNCSKISKTNTEEHTVFLL